MTDRPDRGYGAASTPGIDCLEMGHLWVGSTCTACAFTVHWCLWCQTGVHGGGLDDYDAHDTGSHAGLVVADPAGVR